METELVQRVFDEAVRAFAGRTDIVTKPEFLKLDEQTRARAWTVARVADADVLADLHQAAQDFSGTGGSFREFIDALDATMERRGWEGLEPWHARIVFEQNVGMAYTAGRFKQAQDSGVGHWRYLPSEANEPRPEHEQYYDKIYPLGDGPMPPLDFGCQCSWEVVFDEELDIVREQGDEDLIQDGPPKVSEGQEFQFSPASYFQPLKVDLAKYPPDIREALRRAAGSDAQLQIEAA